MPEGGTRYMRLLVFFDLPVTLKEDRKAAAQFRKFLLSDGYSMLQFSVYMRICKGQDMVNTHQNRLEAHLPEKGSVRALAITELQYSRIKILLGKPSIAEQQTDIEVLEF